jgi:hypothetical protein
MQRNTKIFVAFILFDFIVFSGYVLAQEGLGGLFEAVGLRLWTWQLSVDLLIAFGVGCWWMVRDARQRGESAWGYVALTCVLGSPGLLIYLLLRKPMAEDGQAKEDIEGKKRALAGVGGGLGGASTQRT